MADSSTIWRDRARAAGFYLGSLPFYAFHPGRRSDTFSKFHYGQAASLILALAGLAFTLLITALVLSYLLVHHRDFYEGYQLERYSLGIIRKLFLAWAVFWGFGLCLAATGSTRPMPLLHRIAWRPAIWRAACVVLIGCYGTIGILVPIAFHGETMAPVDHTTGTVQLLYEDNGIFPRWLFLLAFYPMTSRATALWGDGSVAIQRFDRESAARAFAEANIIYLGTHGTEKGLMLKDGWLRPGDLEDITVNPALRFVYLSGCDSGQQRDGWLSALSPAEVVTYDRLSAVLEHVWWLWFRGPEKLKTLHGELQQ
jgi:hypothetical protein